MTFISSGGATPGGEQRGGHHGDAEAPTPASRSRAPIEGSAETPKGDGLSYPGRGARGNEAEEPGGCQPGSGPRSTAAYPYDGGHDAAARGMGQGDDSAVEAEAASPRVPASSGREVARPDVPDSVARSGSAAQDQLGPPPTYYFKGNMEYAAPGTNAWAAQAWAEIERLRKLLARFENESPRHIRRRIFDAR